MMIPFLISIFLFLPYVTAEAALASTSLASAMPTAIYGSISRKVMSIGLITAAALIPAKPVPSPAPRPAIIHMMIFCIVLFLYYNTASPRVTSVKDIRRGLL